MSVPQKGSPAHSPHTPPATKIGDVFAKGDTADAPAPAKDIKNPEVTGGREPLHAKDLSCDPGDKTVKVELTEESKALLAEKPKVLAKVAEKDALPAKAGDTRVLTEPASPPSGTFFGLIRHSPCTTTFVCTEAKDEAAAKQKIHAAYGDCNVAFVAALEAGDDVTRV